MVKEEFLYVVKADEHEKEKEWTFSYEMLMKIQDELKKNTYELETVPGLVLIETILLALRKINIEQGMNNLYHELMKRNALIAELLEQKEHYEKKTERYERALKNITEPSSIPLNEVRIYAKKIVS